MAIFNKGSVCCICNNAAEDNNYMMMSGDKVVCNKCANEIEQMRMAVRKFESELDYNYNTYSKKGGTGDKVSTPADIKAYLDQYVVGQEHAKKILSVACYNHYKRCELQDDGIKKSNVLLVGPTGSGKTYLVEKLGQYLNVPVAMAAATSLTEAGYIGDDVETVVKKLLDAADGDVKKAERGIIFIDEIDKLSGRSSETEKKVGGKGVQQALLPLLEGSVVSVDRDGDPRKLGFKVNINTKGILFICGGAFPEAEEIIKRRLTKKSSIGFTASIRSTELDDISEAGILKQITSDDLREFGLIPEFIGRLPVIATLDSLGVEMLKKILTEPKDSLLSQYKRLLEFDGVNLVIEDEALDLIAEKAFKKGTGARSLRSIMEDLLLDIMFNVPSRKDIDEVYISKEAVEGKEEPYYHERSNIFYATGR